MRKTRNPQEPSELEGYKPTLVGGVAVMYSRKDEIRYEKEEEAQDEQA